MSRTLSFRDLQRIPPFNSMSELEMVHPDSDPVMKDALGQLGFDTTRGITYAPFKHRDMMGHVAVGFMAQGIVSNDRAFLNSRVCHPMERVVAGACHGDLSLTQELCSLMTFGSPLALIDDEEPKFSSVREGYEYYSPNLIEPDYEMVSAQIASLTMLRDAMRGDPYDNYGRVKPLCYVEEP